MIIASCSVILLEETNFKQCSKKQNHSKFTLFSGANEMQLVACAVGGFLYCVLALVPVGGHLKQLFSFPNLVSLHLSLHPQCHVEHHMPWLTIQPYTLPYGFAVSLYLSLPGSLHLHITADRQQLLARLIKSYRWSSDKGKRARWGAKEEREP